MLQLWQPTLPTAATSVVPTPPAPRGRFILLLQLQKPCAIWQVLPKWNPTCSKQRVVAVQQVAQCHPQRASQSNVRTNQHSSRCLLAGLRSRISYLCSSMILDGTTRPFTGKLRLAPYAYIYICLLISLCVYSILFSIVESYLSLFWRAYT